MLVPSFLCLRGMALIINLDRFIQRQHPVFVSLSDLGQVGQGRNVGARRVSLASPLATLQ
jgi:hypothetical protein